MSAKLFSPLSDIADFLKDYTNAFVDDVVVGDGFLIAVRDDDGNWDEPEIDICEGVSIYQEGINDFSKKPKWLTLYKNNEGGKSIFKFNWVDELKELIKNGNVEGIHLDGLYEEKKMKKFKESDENALTLSELAAERDRVLVEGLETIVNQQVAGKAAPYVCAFFNPDYADGYLIIQNNVDNIVEEIFSAIQNSDASFEFWAETAIYDGESPEYAVQSYLDDNHMVLMVQSATALGSWEVSF